MSDFLSRHGINFDLVDYLAYKGYQVVRYTSGYKVKPKCEQGVFGDLSSLSIHLNRQSWKRWSNGTHGSNVLFFCQIVLGMSFQDAVKELGGIQKHVENLPLINGNQVGESSFVLPEGYQGNPSRLYAYLIQTRKIAPEIVKSLLCDGYIYQDIRGNVVFVGRDQYQQARFACLRGTYSAVSFKKECLGSDKRFSFSIDGVDKQNLYIFESPIDLLSAGTLANRIKENPNAWRYNSRLSLAGVSDVALAYYLSVHSSVTGLHFWLDNDLTGRKASKFLCQKYSAQGFRVWNHCPRNKDMNEDLKEWLSKK